MWIIREVITCWEVYVIAAIGVIFQWLINLVEN